MRRETPERKAVFPKAFTYTTRRIMPVNGFDGHERRKAYRNHHMPACVTIFRPSRMKIRPPQVRPLQPAPRSEHTFFRRLIMTHNNKLARAKSYANTQRSRACASFLDTANTCANTQKSHAVSAILAQANVDQIPTATSHVHRSLAWPSVPLMPVIWSPCLQSLPPPKRSRILIDATRRHLLLACTEDRQNTHQDDV